jgi:mannose-6-phosphate isomerase-like protein (cupin superfamily)
MNIQDCLTSGILELYCLGNLSPAEEEEVQLLMSRSPEIKKEVERIQFALEGFAQKHAIIPPPHVEITISTLIDNLEKEARMDAENLPLINKFSNHEAWKKLIPKSIPTTIWDDRYCKVLTRTSKVIQMLLISTTDFEDEIHDNLHESFLILEGHCECTVENETLQMKAGDYMEIPLYAHHDVKIQSPYVVAILQRLAV